MPYITLTIKKSFNSSVLDLPETQIFILGAHEKLGENFLNHAKALQKLEESNDEWQFSIELPVNTKSKYKFFSGVRRGKRTEKELSLEYLETKDRELSVDEREFQNYDCGIFGVDIPTCRGCLIDTFGVNFVFSAAFGPLVCLDDEDLKKCTFKVHRVSEVAILKSAFINCNDDLLTLKGNDTSLFQITARVFCPDFDTFTITVAVFTEDDECVGYFVLDSSKIYLSTGRLRVPITKGLAGNRVGVISVSYLHTKPYHQKKLQQDTLLIQRVKYLKTR